jgi:chorismate-pyruvate lyase
MRYPGACLLVLALLFWVFSCEPKEEILTTRPDAILQFSADSVHFDTVFAQTGSVTKRLVVYNFNKQAVEISEIKLGQEDASPYRLLIDGQETSLARGIRIRGQDSLYILVKVLIQANQLNAPFLVNDAITFLLNGRQQQVQLVAYGQNAYFHRNEQLACNSVWTADKPHVLYGDIRVPAGCRLTIEKGTRIYAHAKAALLVAGSLQVEGTAKDRVVFDGDRLEPFYDDIPGQWSGIRLLPGSAGNRLRYADINNAEVGLLADNADRDPGDYDLILEHCILRNLYADGIRSLSADVQARNCLITNCGQHGVLGLGGGTYDFAYCTIANLPSALNRTTPSFAFSDRRNGSGGQQQDYRIRVRLINSIVWGGRRGARLTEELQFLTDAGTPLDTALAYNILQTELYRPTLNKTNKFNEDPQFKNSPGQLRPVYPYDYSLADTSPANGAASPLADILIDLTDKPRDPAKPDIGAYERP